jgi:hypothetical protein
LYLLGRGNQGQAGFSGRRHRLTPGEQQKAQEEQMRENGVDPLIGFIDFSDRWVSCRDRKNTMEIYNVDRITSITYAKCCDRNHPAVIG